MARGKPRRRSAAKIATKREQTELVDHAKRLGADPSPLVPACSGSPPRAVAKLAGRLQRISKAEGKPRRLKWHLKFGTPLTRAYANLLLVGHAGKAHRMASMKTPAGDLKYAVRGSNLPARPLVAVQHFRIPEARILGYRELAQDANGIVWATADGTAFTKRGDAPPEAWFDLVGDHIALDLERDGLTFACPHMLGIPDLHAPTAPEGIHLTLSPGPTDFRVCAECARSHLQGKHGLLATLARYLIGIRATKDVTVEPTGTPFDCRHDGPCAWSRHLPEPPTKTRDAYLSGARDEGALLDSLRPRWTEAVRAAGDPVFVAGDACYGADKDALLDALGVHGDLREALVAFLEAGPDVLIAKEASVNQVLEACWDTAPSVLTKLHPDPAALAELMKRHERSPPGAVLDDVLVARRAHAAMKGYPAYASLPEPADVAFRLAIGHRVGGEEGLVVEVDRELKRNTHKGLVWAAARIAGATQGREWQFTKNDQEAGEFLEEPLGVMLHADPDGFHEALATLYTMAGGAGELPEPRGAH